MVSVRDKSKSHIFAGVLVHPWLVLTAAHCIRRVEEIYVDSRSTWGERSKAWHDVRVEETFIHPNYTGRYNSGLEVALLKLFPGAFFEIEIPLIPRVERDHEHGQVTSLGWGSICFTGRNTTDQLQMTNALEVVPNHRCTSYPDIQDHQLCLHVPLPEDGTC